MPTSNYFSSHPSRLWFFRIPDALNYAIEYQRILDYLRTKHRALRLSHSIPPSTLSSTRLADIQAYQAVLYPDVKLSESDITYQSFYPSDSPSVVINYQHGTPWINTPPFTRWFQVQQHGSPSVSGTGGGVLQYLDPSALLPASTVLSQPTQSTTGSSAPSSSSSLAPSSSLSSSTTPTVHNASDPTTVSSLSTLLVHAPEPTLADHNPRFPPTNNNGNHYNSCFRVDLSDVPGSSFLCVPYAPSANALVSLVCLYGCCILLHPFHSMHLFLYVVLFSFVNPTTQPTKQC